VSCSGHGRRAGWLAGWLGKKRRAVVYRLSEGIGLGLVGALSKQASAGRHYIMPRRRTTHDRPTDGWESGTAMPGTGSIRRTLYCAIHQLPWRHLPAKRNVVVDYFSPTS